MNPAPDTKPSPAPRAEEPGKSRLLVRILAGLVMAAMAALVYWTFQQFSLEQRESNRQNQELSRLTQDIERFNSALAVERRARADTQYQEGLRSLVQGDTGLAGWQESVRQRAQSLNLDCRLQWGTPSVHTQWSNQISLAPVTLEIRPAQGTAAGGSPYQRLLALCQHVGTEPVKADWLELTVNGTSNSISGARVMLNLWKSVSPSS